MSHNNKITLVWFIIIVVGILIFFFAKDSTQQSRAVIKQGGMKIKYRILIDLFLQLDPRMSINQETNWFIAVSSSNYGGSVAFLIHQTFGKVTIQWKTNSALLGKHEIEWTFNEFMDQHAMFDKIENDIGKYNDNVMSNFI